MNTAAAAVDKFMGYLTFMRGEEIGAIGPLDEALRGRKTAQPILADEVTRLVHGEEALQSAKRITEALCSGDIAQLSEQELEQIKLDGLPSSDLTLAGLDAVPMTTLFTECGMVTAGREVKDA